MIMANQYIYLGFEFFGQKIFMEATDNPQIDEDLKTIFCRSYINKQSCEITRPDIQRILDWQKKRQNKNGTMNNKRGTNYAGLQNC